jgi:hypothetical protein
LQLVAWLQELLNVPTSTPSASFIGLKASGFIVFGGFLPSNATQTSKG